MDLANRKAPLAAAGKQGSARFQGLMFE